MLCSSSSSKSVIVQWKLNFEKAKESYKPGDEFISIQIPKRLYERLMLEYGFVDEISEMLAECRGFEKFVANNFHKLILWCLVKFQWMKMEN